MKKFKEKRKSVHFPAFLNYKVVIIKTNNKQKTYDRIRKLGKDLPEDADFAAVHVYIGKDQTSYIIFPEKAKVGMIAHECWHVIRYIIQDFAGAKLDNEVVAYHLGYLTQEASDFINAPH